MTGRRLLRAGAVALGVIAALVGAAWHFSLPAAPDAFYTAPTEPAVSPGTLIRAELFAREKPAGARVWRILYSTTREDGRAAVASGIVAVAERALGTGPRPVVAWTHGTLGVAEGCAPSVLPSPMPFGDTVPAVSESLAEGWVIVATDYVGLGTAGPHPYLIGEGEARSALDSIRAARAIQGLELSDETVVWGHSQGGHAALWTAGLAAEYAPDVRIAGVAAIAPATLLAPLTEAVKATPVGRIMTSYLVSAYADAYPDVRVDDYVRSGARTLVRDMAARCLAKPSALAAVADALLIRGHIFPSDAIAGPLAARLDQNVPRRWIPAPVLIAQGDRDELVVPSVQNEYVAERCATGMPIDYRIVNGGDHLSVVGPSSPLIAPLIEWTRARFAGTPAADGCVRSAIAPAPR